GSVRVGDLHHFDLVELVLADHAAHVAAARTGFGTEARRMRRQLQGKRVDRDEAVTYGAGQCDFRRGDQVGVFATDLIFGRVATLADGEHVVLELGQLAGAQQGR